MREQKIRFLDQDETDDEVVENDPDISIGVRDQEGLAWHLFYNEEIRKCAQIMIGDQDGENVLIWLS